MAAICIPEEVDTTAQRVASAALARATSGGAGQAEVVVTHDAGLSVSARMRDVETIESQDDRGFGVTVYCGQRKGSASTSDFSDAAIAAAVDKALYIASQTGADEYAGLADASLMATDFPDLALDHEWAIDVEAAKAIALETEAAALDADSRISNSEGASVSTYRSHSVYANSHGFTGCQRRSRHSISCAVIAGSGDQMERDYDYASARNPNALRPGVEVGAQASRRALARLSPRKLSTRQSPVVFRYDLAAGLIGNLLSAISGGAQYRKASYLLDAAGQRVLAPALSIHERPHLAEGPGSTAFDAEGVATADRDIVTDGVLQGYVLSSYSARRLGLQTTANSGGVHNAIVSRGDGDLAHLLREMDEGLFVTEMMGQGVNAVTGDYSRGAAGFWVSGGEIAYPVSEITVAANLKDMLANIVGVADDADAQSSIQAGSMLIEQMTIAGS
ncbi:MAG: metalloprotease PmbA [Pseudomonadota bacterium]